MDTGKAILFGLALIAATSSPFSANALDAAKAQGEMFLRVDNKIEAFVRDVGATNDLWNYCRMQMSLDTSLYGER